MKKLTIFIFALLVAAGANAFQFDEYQDKKAAKADSVAIAPGDSTEYELIVLDLDFTSWFHTNKRPVWFHEKEYYHSKNTFYATNWNNRVIESMHRLPYEFQIDYDSKIDYGVDVEWQLFWYFKYLEQKYNIKLGP